MTTPKDRDEFRRFFEHCQDMLCIAGFDGYFKRLNPAWEKILGYTAVELLAQPYLDFIHPGDQARTAVEAEKLGVGARTFSFENRYRHKDGSYRWLLWQASADTKRQIIYASARDVTEFKHLEEGMRTSQDRMQAILDNTPAVVFMKDAEGRYLLANRQFENLFHVSRKQIIGKTDLDIFPPDMARAFRDNDAKVLAAGKAMLIEEFAPHDDGLHPYLSVKFPLLDASGVPNAIGGIATDITERKIAERNLQRSNLELEQFAYATSHDLQEPLRLMVSYIQLLEKRYEGMFDERATKFIRTAAEAGRRMHKQIEDLLLLSRVSSRGKALVPTDSGRVLETVLAQLALAIEESGATITHDAMPVVVADEMQLGQVLQNLIANAIKFHGDKPPKIHVGAQRKGGTWQISVKDGGIGINPKFFERIFLIFQRLHTYEEDTGTGIGLAICKKIIDRFGGRVWVESEPGRGATFYFTLSGSGQFRELLAPPLPPGPAK